MTIRELARERLGFERSGPVPVEAVDDAEDAKTAKKAAKKAETKEPERKAA